MGRTVRTVRTVRTARTVGLLVTIAAIAVAGGLAVSMVTAPLERLIVIVPDDAFYYLQIARNLAATGRSTADGLSATNGYHPLWLAVLTPLAAVVSDRELLLRVAVGVSLILHFAASWLIGARVAQVAGRAWGRAASLCWLLNRVALVIALQAMESTLYVVLLLVALGVHLRLAAMFKTGKFPPRRELMIYGASLGLVILARTEGAIVAAAALAWLGVRLWRMSTSTATTTAAATTVRFHALVSWSICAMAAFVIVLPYPLFSLWQVGTIQQDSGMMKALWAGDHFPDAASRVHNLLDTADYFLRGTLRLMWYSLQPLVFTFVLLAIAAAFVIVQFSRPRGRAAIALRAAVVPAMIVGVLFGFTLVDRQIWWMGLPWLAIFLTAMLGTVSLCRAIPALRRRQRMVRFAMVAASMLFLLALARSRNPLAPYPWQADVLHSQAQIEASIPRDQRIGCFNAGISLYFGDGRVVALDGLVSHDALGYWMDRRIDDYLRDARIRFVADEPLTLERALRFSRAPGALRLEERRTFPLRGWPSGRRVLWSVASTEDASADSRPGAAR